MDSTQYNHLYPFHFIINLSGEITQVGVSLKKVIKIDAGQKILDDFKIERPVGVTSVDRLSDYEGMIFLLRHIKTLFQLTGQVLKVGENIVFFMTPKIDNVDQLYKYKLNYNDFSISDSQIEHILTLESQKIVIKDSLLTEKKIVEKVKELKSINAALDSFVYHVSHDLKAPVVNFESMLTMLQRKMKGEIEKDPVLKKILDNLNSTTGNFKSIIEDFLELTRVTKNKAETFEEFNVKDVVQQNIKDLSFELDGIEAETVLNIEDSVLVFSSRASFSVILNNLLSNAVKYRSTSRQLKIEVEINIQNDFIVIRVRDNGIGIDLENQRDRIFEMFERIDVPGTSGTGVGLSIVLKTLQNLNGKIDVESKLGEGSTFIVSIPMIKKDKE